MDNLGDQGTLFGSVFFRKRIATDLLYDKSIYKYLSKAKSNMKLFDLFVNN